MYPLKLPLSINILPNLHHLPPLSKYTLAQLVLWNRESQTHQDHLLPNS